MTHSNSLRIVSLLPSATEILAALDLTQSMVGRSHECDYPAEVQHLPICTRTRLSMAKPSGAIDADVKTLLQSTLSIYEMQLELLTELRPTHIVTQDQCDVCAVSFALVEAAVATLSAPRPTIISLQPHTLTDIWADIERVATTVGVDANPVLTALKGRVEACRQTTQGLSMPTVAAIEWIEPLMGSGNWIPELIELAGGKDLFGAVGEHSPYLLWETLLAADPDVVIIMPCGFDLARTRQEMQQAIATQPQWQQLRAVQQQQLYLTDGNAYFNRPGPRLVDSLEILAEILHPSDFDSLHIGNDWERYV